ncbi:uncharacterized protein LOC124509715 [Lynx rufus]|uniref:uncharacterized protein LOC124509715 n=1 Tax=Lynx rufus TaxID=61384 RepID=UPI001F1288ED|nr:uncharacterized protein LOC124509715 [Lynx rufus]
MDKPLVQPIPERLVPLPPTRFPPTRDEDARDPSLGQRRRRRWGCERPLCRGTETAGPPPRKGRVRSRVLTARGESGETLVRTRRAGSRSCGVRECREQRGAQVFPSGKVKVSRRRGSGRPGHSVAGIGALHPGPGRSSLACVAKSTYEREQGSPERGVPAAAEAVREGAASCAPGSQPLCGGGGGGSLPPPPLSPTRRRALLGSCFPSAGERRSAVVALPQRELPAPALRGPRSKLGTKLRGARSALRSGRAARLCAAALSVIQVRVPPRVKQTRNPRSGDPRDLPKVAQRAVTKQTYICDSLLSPKAVLCEARALQDLPRSHWGANTSRSVLQTLSSKWPALHSSPFPQWDLLFLQESLKIRNIIGYSGLLRSSADYLMKIEVGEVEMLDTKGNKLHHKMILESVQLTTLLHMGKSFFLSTNQVNPTSQASD